MKAYKTMQTISKTIQYQISFKDQECKKYYQTQKIQRPLLK